MTSSEYLSTIEPWLYKTAPFADTWLSDSSPHDIQTLSLALQQSLSSDQSAILPKFSPGPPANSESLEPPRQHKRSSIPVSAKPTKHRSRASKKATTTFITADPENFREMVQQVTGVKFPGGFSTLMKPEPVRVAGRVQSGCLPMLDTSAFLLENQTWDTQTPAASVVAPRDGFDFDSFCGFPTLESWKVI